MLSRPACGLAAALLVTALSGCSGDSDAPTPTVSPTATTTTSAEPQAAPSQHTPAPGEPAVVLWVAVAPASEGDEVFDLTLEQLSDIGYDVAPMDAACQEDTLSKLGREDDPTARGVGVVFDSMEATAAFSTVWTGDIVGSVDGPLLCELPAR